MRPLSLLTITLSALTLVLFLSPQADAQRYRSNCPGGVCAAGPVLNFGVAPRARDLAARTVDRVAYAASAPVRIVRNRPLLSRSYFRNRGYTVHSSYMLAPNGHRVVAYDGYPVSELLASTATTTTASEATATGCENCDCADRLQALEDRIEQLEQRLPFGDSMSACPPIPKWRRLMAEAQHQCPSAVRQFDCPKLPSQTMLAMR